MTKAELITVLKILSVNYSKSVDNTLVGLWYGFFKEFDLKTFQVACQKIIATNEYFPKISEVIAVYKNLSEEQQQLEYAKMQERNKLLV